MALTDNLISYWKLDEASGTRVDSHGSNDLTDNNTVGSATGIINDAASFVSANSESLSIAHASQSGLDFGTGDFTIVFWIDAQGYTTGQYVFMKGDINGAWYGMFTSSSGQLLAITDDGSSSPNVTNTTDVSDGNFHFVVMERSSGTLSLNIDNGTPVTTSSAVDVDNTDAFRIGSRLSGGSPDRYITARIDEFGVWDRALTEQEEADLYNSGAGLAYPFGGGATEAPAIAFGANF